MDKKELLGLQFGNNDKLTFHEIKLLCNEKNVYEIKLYKAQNEIRAMIKCLVGLIIVKVV